MNGKQALALLTGAGLTIWMLSRHGPVSSPLMVWKKYSPDVFDAYFVEMPLWLARFIMFVLAVTFTLAVVYFLRTKQIEE